MTKPRIEANCWVDEETDKWLRQHAKGRQCTRSELIRGVLRVVKENPDLWQNIKTRPLYKLKRFLRSEEPPTAPSPTTPESAKPSKTSSETPQDGQT